jgi:hypothetical protein
MHPRLFTCIWAFSATFSLGSIARAQAIINANGGTTQTDGIRIVVNRATQLQIVRLGANQIYTENYTDANFEAGAPGGNEFRVGSGIYMVVGTGAGAVAIGPDNKAGYVNPNSRSWTYMSRTGPALPNGSGAVVTNHSAIIAARTYALKTTYDYVFPNKFVTLALELNVPAGNTEPVRLYLPTDGNLAGNDNGFHRYLATPAVPTAQIQVYNPGPPGLTGAAMGWRQRPAAPWTAYYGGSNRCQWDSVASTGASCTRMPNNYLQLGMDWSNDASPLQVDSGVGVMWNFGAAAGLKTATADFVFSTYCTPPAGGAIDMCAAVNADEPICSGTTNLCGGCRQDTDCKAGKWCNISTAVCSDQLANDKSLPNDPGHVAPAPILNAKCTVPAAALVCASGVCEMADNKCGFANGTGCSSDNTKCRSGICFPADMKCGLPVGENCTINESCRSGVCTAAGKCDGDSDGDGVPDSVETTLGSDPKNPDTDGDGVRDNFELSATGAGPFSAIDTDADGKPNWNDTDDDGDSISTRDERGMDAIPTDSDGDGQPDYLDADDDNDTIPTLKEVTDAKEAGLADDVDGDGKKNWLDTDADGDAILDRDEPNDAERNGKPDYLEAAGGSSKKPNGQACVSATECISGVCDSDGKCGSPDGKACANASTCRGGVCGGNICSGDDAGSLEGGSFAGCATSPNSANTVALSSAAIALATVLRRRRKTL